jgi:hypothetical protein
MGEALDRLIKQSKDTITKIRKGIDPMGEAKRQEDIKLEDMKNNPEKYEKLEDTLLCIKRDEEGRLMVFNRITNVKDAGEIAFEFDNIMMKFRMIAFAKAQAIGQQTSGGIIIPKNRG